MDLHEVEGDGGVCEADPQDRLVARRAAAQIAQPHLAARNGDFLLQGLQHRQSTAGVSLKVMGGRGSDIKYLVDFGCSWGTGGSGREGGERGIAGR